MLHVISCLCWCAAAALNGAWLLLGDALSLSHQVLIPPLTVALAGTGAALRLRELPPRHRGRYVRGALWVLLGYYLALLSALLFFGGVFHIDRGWGGSVNLVPFHTIRNYLIYYRNTGSPVSVLNLLGNVAIMVPLGVLLPLLVRGMRHWWSFLPLAALVSVGVEALQWLTATGAADVDDSILNFAGAAVGYFSVRCCQMWCAARKKP